MRITQFLQVVFQSLNLVAIQHFNPSQITHFMKEFHLFPAQPISFPLIFGFRPAKHICYQMMNGAEIFWLHGNRVLTVMEVTEICRNPSVCGNHHSIRSGDEFTPQVPAGSGNENSPIPR